MVKPVLEMKGRRVRVPLLSIGRKVRVGVVVLLPWTVAVAELLELTLTVPPDPVPVVLAAVTMVVVEELPVSWDRRPEKDSPKRVPRTIIMGRRVRKIGVKST